MSAKPLTRPGTHGTLYRYAVHFRDGDRDDVWRTWAYNTEHAEFRFYEEPGWEECEITNVRRVTV